MYAFVLSPLRTHKHKQLHTVFFRFLLSGYSNHQMSLFAFLINFLPLHSFPLVRHFLTPSKKPSHPYHAIVHHHPDNKPFLLLLLLLLLILLYTENKPFLCHKIVYADIFWHSQIEYKSKIVPWHLFAFIAYFTKLLNSRRSVKSALNAYFLFFSSLYCSCYFWYTHVCAQCTCSLRARFSLLTMRRRKT